MDDRIVRVARREQNLEIASLLFRFLCQLPTIERSGQAYIGEHKLDVWLGRQHG